MSAPGHEPLITETGCSVEIWAITNGTPDDGIHGIYLHLNADTRHAELKLTPDEARVIGQRLLNKAMEGAEERDD